MEDFKIIDWLNKVWYPIWPTCRICKETQAPYDKFICKEC